MRILRTSLMGVVLGLSVFSATVASAAPAAVRIPAPAGNPGGGADDAAREARIAARKLRDEAANLEKQADADRDAALSAYVAALKAADAKDAQADAKKA